MALTLWPLLAAGGLIARSRGREEREEEKSLQALADTGSLNAYGGGSALMAKMLASQDPAVEKLFNARYQQYADQASPQTKLQQLIAEQQLANSRTEQQGRGWDRMQQAEQAQYERGLRPQQEAYLGAQIGAAQARMGASDARAGEARVGQQMGAIRYLGENYQANMKVPVDVADSVQQIAGALRQGSSVGALTAIIKLAHILDPNSVVREGEVATVEGGMGTAQQLISGYYKMLGKGFSLEGAKAIKQMVLQIAGPVLQRGLRLNQEYGASAGMFGVPPEAITTGVGFPTGFVTRYLQGFPDPEVEADF